MAWTCRCRATPAEAATQAAAEILYSTERLRAGLILVLRVHFGRTRIKKVSGYLFSCPVFPPCSLGWPCSLGTLPGDVFSAF